NYATTYLVNQKKLLVPSSLVKLHLSNCIKAKSFSLLYIGFDTTLRKETANSNMILKKLKHRLNVTVFEYKLVNFYITLNCFNYI
ncbi:hypothetical protein BUE80_DR013548, partial [Diplocarpon rosae]